MAAACQLGASFAWEDPRAVECAAPSFLPMSCRKMGLGKGMSLFSLYSDPVESCMMCSASFPSGTCRESEEDFTDSLTYEKCCCSHGVVEKPEGLDLRCVESRKGNKGFSTLIQIQYKAYKKINRDPESQSRENMRPHTDTPSNRFQTHRQEVRSMIVVVPYFLVMDHDE
eukprot:1160115-Pelagomonas_calceolata.AAC.6